MTMQALISFIIALLSGIGVGGGGLFALYLKLFSSYEQLTVQALNLIFFLFASGSALCIHLMKRKIYPIPVLVMSLCGVLGSLLGTSLAIAIRSPLLSKLFGILLILTALHSLFRRD